MKAPILRLSSTVSLGNSRRFSGTWAIPCSTIRCGGTPTIERPSSVMAPAKAATSPDMTRISVVLPAPLGPITPTVSPAATSSDTPNSARKEPYPAEMSASDSMIDLLAPAQINLRHARVARSLGGQTVENLLAVVEHDHALDDPHQHAHDVLDPDDGYAHAAADAFKQVCGVLHLACVEAAEAFIGEKKSWLGGERTRKLELFQCGGAEPTGGRARVA